MVEENAEVLTRHKNSLVPGGVSGAETNTDRDQKQQTESASSWSYFWDDTPEEVPAARSKEPREDPAAKEFLKNYRYEHRVALPNTKLVGEWEVGSEAIPKSCKGNKCMLSDIQEVPFAKLKKKGLTPTVEDDSAVDDECIVFTVHIEIDEPRPKQLEFAKWKLQETDDKYRSGITKLRTLLEEQKGTLYTPYQNDAWLRRFLRRANYNADTAFNYVKNYYNIKKKYKEESYTNLKPSTQTEVFEQDIMKVLPLRDQRGRRLLLLELGNKWNYIDCPLEKVFQGAVLFMEAILLEPETQICGVEVIIDLKDLSSSRLNASRVLRRIEFVKKIIDWAKNCLPLRVEGIHIVNNTYLLYLVYNVIKPMLSQELIGIINVHGSSMTSLHKEVLPQFLPENYGGTCKVPMIPGPVWREMLLKLDDEYEEINKYGYKEN